MTAANNQSPASSTSDRKTALVTGGTSGIGHSLLPELLKRDYDVYFIGTNASKGAQVEEELNSSAGPQCKFIQLDLSNLQAVREFGRQFVTRVPKLDVLLSVAGVMLPEREVTLEGFEKTFAIDYFSTVVLCRELIPSLEAGRPSRIVNVAGDPKLILKPRLNFDDLMREKNYNMFGTALDAVNAKTVFTEILAEELRPRGIDVNSFHPGNVKGDLGRSAKFPMNLLFEILKPFKSSTCVSGIYASTSDELTGKSGQFIVKETFQALNFEQEYKDKLWKLTEELLKPIYDEK